MIEKLDSKMDCVEITVLGKHTECLGFDSAKEINKKLNELVDAVNGMLYWHENLPRFWQNLSKKENTENKEPTDPYAEQRKWIGKLCKFWNKTEYTDNIYGCLTDIVPTNKYKPEDNYFVPFKDEFGSFYEHCEPVKPDDDIIYKGGNNE